MHQHRLGLAHPVRATADADFGVPPYALRDDSLVAAVSRLGYRQVAGNRWSRPIDETREATVDLLVPSYRTRLRSSVRHGGTNTTEVGGMALALKRLVETINPALNVRCVPVPRFPYQLVYVRSGDDEGSTPRQRSR